MGKKRESESFYKELMTKNFPNQWRKRSIQTQEAQKTSNRMNLKATKRYIIIQLLKVQVMENFESIKRNVIYHVQESLIKVLVGFSAESL